MQWVVQFLLPELLDAAHALPSPPPPSLTAHLRATRPAASGSSPSQVPAVAGLLNTTGASQGVEDGSGSGGADMEMEVGVGEAAGEAGRGGRGGVSSRGGQDPGQEVRVQLAAALHATADAFGGCKGALVCRCVREGVCA